MSAENNQLELPPVEKAAQVRQSIVQEVFFAKLADFGIVPQTEEQAASLWRQSEQCLAINNNPAVKQANLQADPILQAEQKLAELSGQYGFNSGVKSADEHAILNQLAVGFGRNPDVYASMLSLAHAESAAQS